MTRIALQITTGMEGKMKRQLMWMILLISMWHSPLQAQSDFTTPIVEQLENQGYTVSTVKRTWLGRILIVANTDETLREIVLNRKTGAILNDQIMVNPYAGPPTISRPSLPSNSNGPAATGPDGPAGGTGGAGHGN